MRYRRRVVDGCWTVLMFLETARGRWEALTLYAGNPPHDVSTYAKPA